MCVYVYLWSARCVCVCACTHVWTSSYLCRPEKSVGSSGTGVTSDYGLPSMGSGSWIWDLWKEEQQALLSTESSHSPIDYYLSCVLYSSYKIAQYICSCSQLSLIPKWNPCHFWVLARSELKFSIFGYTHSPSDWKRSLITPSLNLSYLS